MFPPVNEAPKSRGIPRTFKISSKEAATLKIPKTIANVSIMYWCEFKSLIYNDLNQEHKQSRSVTAKQSLKPDVQTYAKKMYKYLKRKGIFNLYQIEFDTVKNEMLQQQYEILKRNNKLEKKVILEELLQKGLTSIRNELNNQGESSKSGSSSNQKENNITSLHSESPRETSEAKSSGLINVQHVLYQDALKLHQLYTEKKKLSPQQKKKNGSWFVLYS